MKIGVLGGTFDPVHNGHMIVAEETRRQLDLSEVLFVPAGQPWLKEDSPILAAEHRIQMVRLAIAEKPYFRLSTVEVDRDGPTYTVDTIAELRTTINDGDELFFMLGWDNLVQLPQWKEISRVIGMCSLVAIYRPGYQFPDLSPLETAIPGLSQKLIILDKPAVDISATDIRRRVCRGLSIGHLVPEPVDEYIKTHGLYLTG